MDMEDTSDTQMEDPSHQTDVEDSKQIEDGSDLIDHLENLTKVPIQNVQESLEDHSTKTKSAALNAKNLAICKRTVQN